MDSPPPLLFDDQEADEYQSAEEAMEILPDSESEGYEVEVESMTGKGISRLCSELLELKKASNEDFQRNIHSNYSAFLRIFEEIGGIENEILNMKNHISMQKMLVEELMNSFQPEIVLEKFENVKDETVEDLDLDFPSWLETRMQNILETLDILMSEHRMEEALVILEKENQALQKLQMEKDCLFPIISPFSCAILYWRTRLADQLASLAGHKRVTWPELHNALFGLIRLGENDRVSNILLNFFHLQLQNKVNELKCSTPSPYGTHILELTKVIFFTIIQASRTYVVLFGETSPYTSDILQWARSELEVICKCFDMYVKSLSETSLALGLAVEIMNLSFSFCSLLESEKLSLQPDVVKLMKPCIKDLLGMHFDQLRKVVSLFVNTDDWVLGKFIVSGNLSNKSSFQNINEKLEYGHVTSSGRKFVTLVQMVLDDTYPFLAFHLENLILKGLTGLFNEYIHTLEKALTIRRHVECDFSVAISGLKLHQQISILVSSSELLHLLPTLVQNSFNSTIFASVVVLSEQGMLSSRKELDLWKLEIQEISDRLKSCFLMLFVSGIMNHGISESMKELDTCICGHCVPGSSGDPMPSFVFQELFMQLRHVEEQYESMLLIQDGMMNNLLNDIMMNVVFQLAENWEFLKNMKSCKQLLLDVHFLMEIARAGDYFSDNLMVAALDLMRTVKLELSIKELQLNSDFNEEEWAFNAAKLAIKTLNGAGIAQSEPKFNSMVDYYSNGANDNHECTHERIYKLDDEFVHSMPQPLQNSIFGATVFNNDKEGSRNPTTCDSCIEDEQTVIGTDTTSDKLSNTISNDEVNADEFTIITEEVFGRDCTVLCSTDSLKEIRLLTGIDESVSDNVENQVHGVLGGRFELQNGRVNVSNSIYLDGKYFAHENVSSEVLTPEAVLTLQTEDLHYDGADEMSRVEVQHSKEMIVDMENDQKYRNEAEDKVNTEELQQSEGKLIASSNLNLYQEKIPNDECSSLVRNSLRYSLETNGGRDRPNRVRNADGFKSSRVTEKLKNCQVGDGIGKIKMGKTTRPQWQ